MVASIDLIDNVNGNPFPRTDQPFHAFCVSQHFQSAERIVFICKGHRMNQHSMKVRPSQQFEVTMMSQ